MKRILLFLFFIFTALSTQAGLFDKKPAFLPVDEAFQFSAAKSENQENVIVNWSIAEGYYLYQEKISVKLNQEENASFDVATFSISPEDYNDPYFGLMKIFKKPVQAIFKASQSPLKAEDMVEIAYQGCTEGFCYPPEVKEIKVADLPIAQVANTEKTSENSTALSAQPKAEQDRLAESLFNSKYAVFGFFLLGLGLAFTPCVLPMLPLLSAIVIGQNQRPNMWRAFALSFVYVQGMAVTYTLLGLVVAAIGLPFQVALQHPYVMIGLSIIFVLLALSMFGVFTLQLPSSLQTKLSLLSQQQKAGAFGGVFLMGMIAGLVASPCTSAPLSGALLYVAQSGDLFTGAITLYLLALGMGVPLILITLFGNKILPKSGMWMETVKKLFGFVMLALPVFLISRILPEEWTPRLWAMLGTAFFIWFAFQMPKNGTGWVFRILFLVAAMISVKPLQTWVWGETSTPSAVENKVVSHVEFKKVKSEAELQQALAENNKPLVMLDLYADWCVACKEFEKETFSDPSVQKAFGDMLLLQVDMTKNSEENRALMTKYKVLGLPTILFFNQDGKEIEGSRINGFMPPVEFLQWIEKISKA
ncbi:MAG: protein-disulfide reductase DsbD [Haemophilus parainfluenzae]|uniref:protein-disulfide reductase DsbD n=2 Tax=uncultured Haemophilus sp. TaxID=237779 RepID=UPI0015A79476|nr:protein-disulfide reductase DsbD [uncultured Haemophilus sp.]MDU4566803.1 protein-disulfide reductase DsbD [Haemophilus parainfluenzae]MDU4638719.1 protein-disulfide reductase DsbD [Haemophilus parainfluenzae]MDU5010325.1 protein-disulfide reductase DsbD [Haemophilus parainfluenzae]MDU5991411.1 protein-disulfide reductase DsbD [Haemophilus parainfluenzae]